MSKQYTEHSKLSEADCRSLQQFFDNESGWLAKRRVARLLKSSSDAREFLASLQSQQLAFRSMHLDSKPVDLWARIDARIQAEVRGEMFLGQRETLRQARFRWWPESRTSRWGIGAPALAFACMAAVFVFQGSNARNAGPVVKKNSVVTTLSTTKSGMSDLERRLEIVGTDFDTGESGASNGSVRSAASDIGGYPSSAMGIDWVRSDGRLRVLQSPEEGSAVIFVRPREPLGGQVQFGQYPQGHQNRLSRRMNRSQSSVAGGSFSSAIPLPQVSAISPLDR